MKNLISILFILLLLMSTSLMAKSGTYSGGAGTASGDSEANAIYISSEADLIELSITSADWGLYFKQTADITYTTSAGDGFSPIGREDGIMFTGTYDGNYKTITNLYINRTYLDGTGDWISLFGATDTPAIIKNLGVVDVNITGHGYVAGLVASSYGNISNCFTTGTVSCNGECGGGLVGFTALGEISSSYSTADVSGPGWLGGFAGYPGSNATINNCYSTGDVTRSEGTETSFGAFAGIVEGASITNCYSTGSVFYNGDDPTDRGFVAFSDASLDGPAIYSGNFFDSDVSNQRSDFSTPGPTATAKTTIQMTTESTFTDAGWTFSSSAWSINPSINGGYPYLTWAATVDQALPVELASFIAIRKDCAIELKWVTESETENLGFLIERSENEGYWHEIASFKDNPALSGQGSVTYRTDYNYVDVNIKLGITYDYRIADVSYQGDIEYHYLESKLIEASDAIMPTDLTVYSNYPNPFNPSTNLSWYLKEADHVSAKIYDMKGQLVIELINRHQSAGYHEMLWDGNDKNGVSVVAGVYLLHVKSGNHTQTSKMLMLK